MLLQLLFPLFVFSKTVVSASIFPLLISLFYLGYAVIWFS